MLYSRTSLGLEIGPSALTLCQLSGTVADPCLEKVARVALEPGALRPSLREQNVLNAGLLTERLTEAYGRLQTTVEKVSVSIPDSIGRILLMDVEGRFKGRKEALDIIRWKLKKSIPFDVADVHLDYQLLKLRENGEMSLLVGLVSREVIHQYEDIVSGAGLIPARIDFNVLSHYSAFEHRLELSDAYAMVSFLNGSLGVMACCEGVPEFLRAKDLTASAAADERLFVEISSSLQVFQERFPERPLQSAYCLTSPDNMETLCAMVSEIAGCAPVPLEIKSVVRPADTVPGDQQTLYPFTAAIGAAMRGF